MAYAEYTITSLSQIPSLVSAFATSVGWDVSGATLRHPDYEGGGPGGLAFTLSTSTVGLNHDLLWTCTTSVGNSALIRAPILATELAPAVGVAQPPTRVFLISMLTPEPYIAIVVEFGYNSYRHLYLGFMEKIGNYSGGEVISGASGFVSPSNSDLYYLDRTQHNYLFGANQSVRPLANSGGVHVSHADNPVPWRNFRDVGTFNANHDFGVGVFNGSEAIGGFGDSINDGYVQKGKSDIAGASILVPINLFAAVPVTGDTRFSPIGKPAGVRMINIENVEAQATLDLGGETWRSFAVFRKNADNLARRPGNIGNRYRLAESSFFVGYAYRSA